ncbi:kunitz-type serine protease inhibitor bitisilin-3-like [Pseudonaja textilis]|uniref:kunitz-type serine protease inhibitor bitisilin-3-like n=1 Tax=Pseudonaja textilis TaxID=8673 RepID=UPI000EA8B791|nr:kunitz-type serine protease inhibitor bitisilin-3-like [Pseudonaja textilis]
MPVERFFYNATSKSCQFFIDYGCSGSLNSYLSAKECEEACKNIAVHPLTTSIPSCYLPPEHGSCKDHAQRWFYDPKTQSCKTFTFTGCKANANNFNTRAACQRRCYKRGTH